MEWLKDFIGIMLHLQEHLDKLTHDYGPWIYAILFVIVFCETGLVVTPFLPGDSLLFAVGAVAARPDSGLNVWIAGFLLLAASICGDTTNYWVGRLAGRSLSARFPGIVKPEYVRKTESFFEVYGAKTMIMARFVPIVRTFAPFVAGMGMMHYPRFMTFIVLGAACWVGFIVPCGWFFGQLPFVKKHFEAVVVGIIFISVLPMVIEYWKSRRASASA